MSLPVDEFIPHVWTNISRISTMRLAHTPQAQPSHYVEVPVDLCLSAAAADGCIAADSGHREPVLALLCGD